MSAETISAIGAIAAAAVAFGAAIASKRSADRSVAAEERSAKAAVRSADASERSAKTAEHALDIERERRDEERRQLDERDAPILETGEESGNVWYVEPRDTVIRGLVQNVGAAIALVERVVVQATDGPDAVREQLRFDTTLRKPFALAPAGAPLEVEVAWPPIHGAGDGDITVIVTFASGNSDFRAEAVFRLQPIRPDVMGQRMWRSVGSRVRRL